MSKKTKTKETKVPKSGLIPIPPMTRNWGQMCCFVELDWKRGRVVSLLLHVPTFKEGKLKPFRIAYRIPCSSPSFHLSDSLDIAQTVDVGWCKEHRKPCYGFYFPVGTRFIDVSNLHSDIYIRFDFIMAKPDELNQEERRVINLIKNDVPKSYRNL